MDDSLLFRPSGTSFDFEFIASSPIDLQFGLAAAQPYRSCGQLLETIKILFGCILNRGVEEDWRRLKRILTCSPLIPSNPLDLGYKRIRPNRVRCLFVDPMVYLRVFFNIQSEEYYLSTTSKQTTKIKRWRANIYDRSSLIV